MGNPKMLELLVYIYV